MVNIIQFHSSLCRSLVELYLTQTAVQSKKKAKVFPNGNFSIWLLQKLKVLCHIFVYFFVKRCEKDSCNNFKKRLIVNKWPMSFGNDKLLSFQLKRII